MSSEPSISIIVPTLGRARELARLLESVERQTLSASEVVVVDRSGDGKISDMLMSRAWGFNLVRLPTPPVLGTSYAMNQGWPKSTGSHLLFADDDCWYPPWLLARVLKLFQETGSDIVAGRAADEHGRSILGRYETVPQPIARKNVWTSSIEWMIVFRREVVEAVDGFDATIGLGASTPWQAAPGQDILLRALSKGYTGYFDPGLYGFHPEPNIVRPDPSMCRKARAYGRGMGYVLRRHSFGMVEVAGWIARPLAGAVLYALKGEGARASYYWNAARGRLEGWRGKTATLSDD
ncbi:MAG TPA: glycosyltransferase family A protein [Hyphomicrobiaceae bacterium]|nr:glycosyltransferase family A protein [Hyphomicrobiaceae bacterium]